MQLDADTGEERRWVERKIDEVIDLTGEDEGEGVAVNQENFEETLVGNGGDEEPINQIIGEDDIGHNSEEEADGKRTKRGNGDGVKADGNMADREEADGEELVEGGKGGEDDKNRNGEVFNEAAERANISEDRCVAVLSPVSSSASTEAWEGEVRDEDVEMEAETVGLNLSFTITPLSTLTQPPEKPGLPSMAGREEDNTYLASTPVLAPAPAPPVENPLSTDKSIECSKLPSTVKDPTPLSLGGSLIASTSTLHQKIRDAGSSCDSAANVSVDSVDKNSEATDQEKALSEGKLKLCRVWLPRISLQQKGMNSDDTDGIREVKRKSKSSKENPSKVPKTEDVLKREECIGCGEISTNMRRHQKLPHDVPCPNDCCERSFTSEEQLRKHIAEKHGVFARGGVCECGELFPDDLDLAIHISQCAELKDNK